MAKGQSIRFQKAYKPVFPAYLNSAPVRQPLRLPPAQPFWKLKSHTVPTRWSLYRPLLRATYPHAAPSTSDAPLSGTSDTQPATSLTRDLPSIRRHIREQWQKKKHSTSLTQTRTFLLEQYDLLPQLTGARPGCRNFLRLRENSLKRLYEFRAAKAAAKAAKPRPKARVTGGYIYPSVYNPPIVRLKPQPPHISGMIVRRIAARSNRLEKMKKYQGWLDDMQAEREFEEALGVWEGGNKGVKGRSGQVSNVGMGQRGKWMARPKSGYEDAIKVMFAGFTESFAREKAREAMIFTERDMQRAEEGRKSKIRWAQAKQRGRDPAVAEKRRKRKIMWAQEKQRRRAAAAEMEREPAVAKEREPVIEKERGAAVAEEREAAVEIEKGPAVEKQRGRRTRKIGVMLQQRKASLR